MIVQIPSVSQLSRPQLLAATQIAQRLEAAGHCAWIVGGAIRDLARGTGPKDLDMVTSAPPDQVESLFPRTLPIGKAFGIVVVSQAGLDVEVATLRTESDYQDGRHPSEVRFGTSVEEDAARRDFTCNALYLDPLTDQLLDPTGGLEDLERGILRTVGDPQRRFGEDGLRLLRMGRFLALLEAIPADGTLEGAAASLDALRGVSPERVLQELERVICGPRVEAAMEHLLGAGILQAALPVWASRMSVSVEIRLGALRGLRRPLGPALGLAWLLETDPGGLAIDPAPDLDVLDGLRPSKTLRRRVERVWTVRRGLTQSHDLAGLARLLRDPGWEEGCDLAVAWADVMGEETQELMARRGWRSTAAEEDLYPARLLEASELIAAGVEQGPLLGRALRALEDAQLRGSVRSREEALTWLAGWEHLP